MEHIVGSRDHKINSLVLTQLSYSSPVLGHITALHILGHSGSSDCGGSPMLLIPGRFRWQVPACVCRVTGAELPIGIICAMQALAICASNNGLP